MKLFDDRAVTFPYIILGIAFVVAMLMYIIGDEILTPTQTLYNASSTVYSKTNTYATIIYQYWGLLPIALVIAGFIYSQAQAQKRL